MKKSNWLLVLLILIGFVIGTCIGSYFEGTFLNYGQTFGLTSPVVLNMGFIVLTFGLTIHISICGILGVVLALIAYKFIR